MQLRSRLITKYKAVGLEGIFRALRHRVSRKLSGVEDVGTQHILISRRLSALFNSTVAYGPFAGTKLSSEIRWGAGDRGSMLLGIYEKEVIEFLATFGDGRRTFIDIGAADGYYAIGCVKSGLFKKSICFEISEIGQKIIKRNAALNLIEEKIEVHGEADFAVLQKIPIEVRDACVLLIDIEGAEFDFITADLLRKFVNAFIVIEVHDNFVADGSERYKKLYDLCSEHFNCTEVRTGARDLSQYKELEFFPDHDRWLICSESRRRLGKWLFLEPK
tara:strand:- start:4705 stop:5529 length:825 start_codon:yes stop_codon:yes gene_type:complete